MEILSTIGASIAVVAVIILLFELARRAWNAWEKRHPFPAIIKFRGWLKKRSEADNIEHEPYLHIMKELEKTHRVDDDMYIIRVYADWLEHDFKKIALQRKRVPNTSDLPFPADRIERALNRILTDQKANRDIKNGAIRWLQFLDAFRIEDMKLKSSQP